MSVENKIEIHETPIFDILRVLQGEEDVKQEKIMTIEHEIGSDNVFADLGFEDQSAEMMAKAEIARRITSIIKHRHLTQSAAAEILEIDQPKVSKVIRGKLGEFSLARLLVLLMKFDRDIEIVVKKRPARKPAEIRVHAA